MRGRRRPLAAALRAQIGAEMEGEAAERPAMPTYGTTVRRALQEPQTCARTPVCRASSGVNCNLSACAHTLHIKAVASPRR
jgi:hypothetical protein